MRIPFPTIMPRQPLTQLFTSRKYQFMQVNTERRQAGLKDKIPDIKKTLETVQFLQRRKVWTSVPFATNQLQLTHIPSHTQPDDEPLEATFELNDTLYAKANIESAEEVYLWLGVRLPKPPTLFPTFLIERYSRQT